jgi:hypothetical protein
MKEGSVEQKKEQLKYETELLRLYWVTAVAIGGGNASLILGGVTGMRAVLLVIGLLFIVILISACVRQDRTIRRLLRELGEQP